MANIKSAAKRARQTEKRRQRNRRYITASRSAVKQARTALASGNVESAESALRTACSMLDRAAVKGVIHRNNAARRKSRLMAAFNRVRANAQ